MPITLVRKKNGGKADSLNMGINLSRYPYFICMDADSMLQSDALENIVRPILENDSVVACGGLVRVANGVKLENGKVKEYHMPKNPACGPRKANGSFLPCPLPFFHCGPGGKCAINKKTLLLRQDKRQEVFPMAIYVDEKRKLFTLETEHSAYQMIVDRYGYLIHLHYGGRLAGGDCEGLNAAADKHRPRCADKQVHRV